MSMSKRGWIIVSVAAGTVAALAGLAAGGGAYIHRARQTASTTAREAFDPYYALVQYLISLEQSEQETDGA
jgi:hypothetical protein